MLYEFKSRATGTVIMSQDAAERILRIIGKTPQSRGVILPEQMTTAIEALQSAIDVERQTPAAGANHPTSDSTPSGEPIEPTVSLAQRAFPFLEMLRRAQVGGKEITWGD